MRMVLGRFSALCRALVATNQAQPTVQWKAGGVFGRRLVPKCCPKVPFGPLEIDKINANIENNIGSEKVSIFYAIIRGQHYLEIDETIHLFAKG